MLSKPWLCSGVDELFGDLGHGRSWLVDGAEGLVLPADAAAPGPPPDRHSRERFRAASASKGYRAISSARDGAFLIQGSGGGVLVVAVTLTA